MSSNAQPSRSRWGVSALLQQVESKLDVILANDEDLPPKKTPPNGNQTDSQSAAAAAKSAAGGMKASV